MEQNSRLPRTVNTATTTLFRKNVPMCSSLNHIRKLSSVGCSGHQVMGRRSSSPWVLNAPRNIQTNGSRVADTPTTRTA
ncbi:hypothetical protein D9M72_540190 [compost metagenome]